MPLGSPLLQSKKKKKLIGGPVWKTEFSAVVSRRKQPIFCLGSVEIETEIGWYHLQFSGHFVTSSAQGDRVVCPRQLMDPMGFQRDLGVFPQEWVDRPWTLPGIDIY